MNGYILLLAIIIYLLFASICGMIAKESGLPRWQRILIFFGWPVVFLAFVGVVLAFIIRETTKVFMED